MNILITGINNYLGDKLKSYFLEGPNHVTCLVRREKLFLNGTENHPNLSLIRGDLIREQYSEEFPSDLDVAFYFSNYTSEQGGIYEDLELLSLQNYIRKLRLVNCPHFIYVMPLRSPVTERLANLLNESYIPNTIVRTSNIVGKSSPLMDIFKYMTSKFVIITDAKLAESRCQPIALSDALIYLDFIAQNPILFDESFELGGPDTLTYREMLEQYLKLMNINKTIITAPFIHHAISTYWLSRTIGVSKATAQAFNKNVQGDILCKDNHIIEFFPHECMSFKDALKIALDNKKIDINVTEKLIH